MAQPDSIRGWLERRPTIYETLDKMAADIRARHPHLSFGEAREVAASAMSDVIHLRRPAFHSKREQLFHKSQPPYDKGEE